ncbi:type II toxin-antitoxin system VapC family toxin [Variovorax sp. WS11]|uniref:type II toxin-antitoxin system VapC family toxin n=1 Tax=Variovorax sp. WS11 TaxID=1105204 RepID=UPI00194F3104|nr:type II toxin-antitoxin system VapC family toxin [Variovorax sp. WS11]
MMFLLDTNVISELRHGTRADAQVRAWAAAHVDALLFISAITLLELERGVLLKARRDAPQGERLAAWLHKQVVPSFNGRTLAVDGDVALCAAKLHVPDPMPERDGLIAATALVHGMTVVTRNIVDFERTGVRLENPWEAR